MWCDAARYPTFFFLDARALISLMVFALHWSWWTFYISAGCMAIFGTAFYFGLTPEVLFRMARRLIAGNWRGMRKSEFVWRRRARTSRY